MIKYKFRGKTSNGEWVYGDLQQNIDAIKIREQEIEVNRIAKSFVVMSETIGQYTGFKDKDGIEIYENDILCDGENTLVVYFNNSIGAFVLGTYKDLLYEGPKDLLAYCDDIITCYNVSPVEYYMGSYKVIGNIFDNKELLYERN